MSIQQSANQRFYAALILERAKLAGDIFKIDTFKAATLVDKLTPRERQVVEMSCFGLDRKEIGRRLGLSWKTVKWNQDQIAKKLGVTSKEYGRIWFAYKFHEAVRVGNERTEGRKVEELADHTVMMSWDEVISYAREYAFRHWRHTKRAIKLEFTDLHGSLADALDGWFQRTFKDRGFVTTFDTAYQIEVWVIAQKSQGKDDCPILPPMFDSYKGKVPTGNVSSHQ